MEEVHSTTRSAPMARIRCAQLLSRATADGCKWSCRTGRRWVTLATGATGARREGDPRTRIEPIWGAGEVTTRYFRRLQSLAIEHEPLSRKDGDRLVTSELPRGCRGAIALPIQWIGPMERDI